MEIRNADISELFKKTADFLEIEGSNPFRVRAYRHAARTIAGLARTVTVLIAEDPDLTRLNGIGKELDEKIKEIVRTGKLGKLEELEERVPHGLHRVLNIPGLGPRKVKALYDNLGIENIEDLKKAARRGDIRDLEGFGLKSEDRILKELGRLDNSARQTLWISAEKVARSLIEYLERDLTDGKLVVCGSFRRRKETVGDLDVLVVCQDAEPIIKRFANFAQVDRVLSHGHTRASIQLRSGLQVDLRVVDRECFGAALHYFTGSQAHNIAIRRLARQKGLKINEYGVFRSDRRVAGRSEEEVFAQVGLSYIAPELREDGGEIQAARENRLPALISLEDIRGDLHCHTDDSDGHNSLAAMVREAELRGYEYIAVTNHTGSLKIARGLETADVKRLLEKIDRLNQKLPHMVILKSMEVDILKDGTLDLPNDILKELDFTVCSIHSHFGLSRTEQTERILRAMDNPYFNIMGHPSGRLLNRRPAYELDLNRLVTAAAERGCFMELNAHPERLDLDDVHCRMAKDKGVGVAISTDAHRIDDFDYMRLGVAQARRGWLEPQDVLNTRELDQLMKLLQRS
jgi:DNA polymerase (family 10)